MVGLEWTSSQERQTVVSCRSCRRRRLPGTAPNPPRGARGRLGVSPLFTKQRSRRRRARGSLARAPASAAPPTPPASPLRAHSPLLLPHGLTLQLPPPARPRARACSPFRSLRACAPTWTGRTGRNPEKARASDVPPTSIPDGLAPAHRGLRPPHAARPHAAEHARSGHHCGGVGELGEGTQAVLAPSGSNRRGSESSEIGILGCA